MTYIIGILLPAILIVPAVPGPAFAQNAVTVLSVAEVARTGVIPEWAVPGITDSSEAFELWYQCPATAILTWP